MAFTIPQQSGYATLGHDSGKLRCREPETEVNDSSIRLRCRSTEVASALLTWLPSELHHQPEVLSRAVTDVRLRPEMTIGEFVRRVFVPEHVANKKLPGRIHYQAMLKHVLTPEEVDSMFQIDGRQPNAKLRAVPSWPYVGGMRLCDTRPEDIQQLVETALTHGYSGQTIKHIRSVVSAIFNCATRKRLFAGENPAGRVVLPEVIHKEAHVLTLSQVKEVLRAMRYPEREMALLILLTDMNLAEICGLQWKFVNLAWVWTNVGDDLIQPRSIAVRKQWYLGELTGVSRKSRIRAVPIPDALLPVLRDLWCRAEHAGGDDFVVVSESGRPVNERRIAVSRLRSIGEELKIPLLSWQTFRHTRADLAHKLGVQFQNLIMSESESRQPVSALRQHFTSGTVSWTGSFGYKSVGV